MFRSQGILRYSEDPLKLIVEIDPEISAYYRSLIPKWILTNRPRYAPHISVMRYEIPPNMKFWKKYQNQYVDFLYEPYIHIGYVYCWLNVHSKELENILEELGLPISSKITRPPDSFVPCFHTTIANRKNA